MHARLVNLWLHPAILLANGNDFGYLSNTKINSRSQHTAKLTHFPSGEVAQAEDLTYRVFREVKSCKGTRTNSQ
jgi:hypothetical protein